MGNNATGDSANPRPKKQKEQRIPKGKNTRPWIAPAIFAAIGTLIVAISSLLGHWNELWVKLGIIPASLVAGSIGIYEFFAFRRKCSKLRSALIAVFSFLVFGAGVILAYVRPLASPPAAFSVVARTTCTWWPREHPSMWLEGNGVIYPVNTFIFIQVTSLNPGHCMIDSYWIENKTVGRWNKVHSIDVRGGTLMFAPFGNLQKANKDDFGNQVFDSIAENKSIDFGETVQGWIFLEMPKEGFGPEWRIHIHETSGNDSLQPIQPGRQPTTEAEIIQQAQIYVIGPPVDISHIRRAFLSDNTEIPHE